MADIPADRFFSTSRPPAVTKPPARRRQRVEDRLARDILELWYYLGPAERSSMLNMVRSLGSVHPQLLRALEAREAYIPAAIAQAQYEILSDNTVYAEIPGLPGVWANAPDHEAASSELAEVLEGWLALHYERRRPIPVVNGLDINPPTVS